MACHDLQAFGAALELDGAGTCAHEAGRVGHSLGAAAVVAGPGHVSHHELGRFRPRHRGRVADHVFHGHLEGVLVAEHDHAERVANKDEVDSRGGGGPGGGSIVRRHHDKRLATAFAVTDSRHTQSPRRNSGVGDDACTFDELILISSVVQCPLASGHPFRC